MHIDQQWIPAISGGFGAGGAVLAQIVAAVFTGRREKKALTARREDDAAALKQRREDDAALVQARREDDRAVAFLDQKRELYLKVLHVLDTDVRAFVAFFPDAEIGTVAVSIPTGVLNTEAWQSMSAEVDLLAPDVVRQVNACLIKLQAVDLAVSFADIDGAKEKLKEVRALRTTLRDAMRVSLGVG